MWVICTAGHVDHGKSSLVTALTGMQPDRLTEERRRGLTIDLGFAWTRLAGDRTVAFVDLPGHERFIGNMLAGAGPVEMALLVVAVTEGWMPQSAEHLAILDLLGVGRGVVALTKTDAADPDMVEVAELEVREALAGTTLADAPVVATSARTGAGLDALRDALRAMCEGAPGSADRGRPRLWIDRAFSVRGVGTVVTGTLAGGGLAVGDALAVAPGDRPVRVRGLQCLGHEVTRVAPGARVAVNVVGAAVADVGRGRALVSPERWHVTRTVDVWTRVVRGQRLSHTGAWHAHVGSGAQVARVYPLRGGDLVDGAQGPVRIELTTSVPLEAGDRVVLREVGRNATVAGGPVLDPAPLSRPRGRAARAQRAEQLTALRATLRDRRALLATYVAQRGHVPGSAAEAAAGVHPAVVTGLARLGDHYVAPGALDDWVDAIGAAVDRHHATHPLDEAVARPVIEQGAVAAGCPAALLDALLDAAQERGALVRAVGGVRRPGHGIRLTDTQRAARERLVAALGADPFAPPSLTQAAARSGASHALVAHLERTGVIVRLTPDIAVLATAVDDAVRRLAAVTRREGPVTTSRARAVLDTTRKYAVPLLEELDRRGVTRRAGDRRVVAVDGGTAPSAGARESADAGPPAAD